LDRALCVCSGPGSHILPIRHGASQYTHGPWATFQSSPSHQHQQASRFGIRVLVKLPQDALSLLILNLDHLQRRPDEAQAFGLRDVVHAGFVLAGAEMLDLFAGIFDFGEAEGGGAAFEEVAEGGKGAEIFGLSVRERGIVSMMADMGEGVEWRQRGGCWDETHKAVSIFTKVASACSKKP